jgi:hypothetical protein
MNSYQTTTRVSRLGSRYPRQVAVLRIGIGIWLLVLAAGLYGIAHAGQWAWLLIPIAALHFGLAYRLFGRARRDRADA